MNEIFEKIKTLFNKIINKEELLTEDTKIAGIDSNNSEVNSSINASSNNIIDTMNQRDKSSFIENTYEVDRLKHRLESDEESINNIPYEKKIELIRSYEEENEMLRAKIKTVLKNSNNNE